MIPDRDPDTMRPTTPATPLNYCPKCGDILRRDPPRDLWTKTCNGLCLLPPGIGPDRRGDEEYEDCR
jgi:hypothetical protein